MDTIVSLYVCRQPTGNSSYRTFCKSIPSGPVSQPLMLAHLVKDQQSLTLELACLLWLAHLVYNRYVNILLLYTIRYYYCIPSEMLYDVHNYADSLTIILAAADSFSCSHLAFVFMFCAISRRSVGRPVELSSFIACAPCIGHGLSRARTWSFQSLNIQRFNLPTSAWPFPFVKGKDTCSVHAHHLASFCTPPSIVLFFLSTEE